MSEPKIAGATASVINVHSHHQKTDIFALFLVAFEYPGKLKKFPFI